MSVNIVDKSTGNLTKIAGNPIEQASGISYDHTSSGMQANNVQAAVDELKSGLTNYQTQNDINLEVPNRKNILPMTVDGIKAANSGATWTGNTTTISGVTYTIETDDGGNVIGILANGKCTVVWHSVLYLAITDQIDSSIFLTGCPSGGNANTFEQQIYDAINDSVITRDYGDGDNNNPILSSLSEGLYVRIVVRYDYTANNLEFRPMIRPATITDPTFAPYIPSVDARLDAVEMGEIYSTTPVKIGNWFGNDLYRKVINIGNLPIATTKIVDTGLLHEKTVRLYGFAKTINDDYMIPLPFISGAQGVDRVEIAYREDDHRIAITSSIDLSSFSGYVVVEYYLTQ